MIDLARKRGVALITAMLITAIAASVAIGLASDNALDVRRTMNLVFHEQGQLVALGAESWVLNILRDDGIDSTTDHLGELWASELPGLPVDNDSVQGAVTGTITDLEGRFNVNKLVDANGETDPVAVAQFERLLQALDLDIRFAGLAADWIDSDKQANFPYGAEDSIYTGMNPPYRTFNQLLSNVSELASLEGMDKLTMDILRPHVTALPRTTKINVNTATAAVLRSLGQNIDDATVESLLEMREGAGFADYEVLFANHIDPDLDNEISEISRYFQLKAVVQIGTVRVTYYSTIMREPDGGPAAVLLRSLGTT